MEGVIVSDEMRKAGGIIDKIDMNGLKVCIDAKTVEILEHEFGYVALRDFQKGIAWEDMIWHAIIDQSGVSLFVRPTLEELMNLAKKEQARQERFNAISKKTSGD